MSESGNYTIVPEALYFDIGGVEYPTPDRFNIIFDAINANVDKDITPAPVCDAFTDVVTYFQDPGGSTTVPSAVTIADVTAWPASVENNVDIGFELESGNIGALGSPTGSGAGAQVTWTIDDYTGSLGSDNTEVVTVKMTALWGTTTKYAYTTFNLTTPAEKGDPGINRLIPKMHCADLDMSLDGPVSGDAEFALSDASSVLSDDTISRAWKLFSADDLDTELLATAPNIHVGTVTGNIGDPDFEGGANGATLLQVPIKRPGQYVTELWIKGILDTAQGDPITTTTPVKDTAHLLVKPYSGVNLTFADALQPIQPLHIDISQGVASSTIIDSDYSDNRGFSEPSMLHYVDVSWGYKPNEPDTDGAKIAKMSPAAKSALSLPEAEYYLVNLNTGSLRAADYWNSLRLWLDGQITSGYQIIDTLSSSERSTIDGLYSGFNRAGFDTVVIKTSGENTLITGEDYSSVLTSQIWQIGPGAEKYKVELAVMSPVDGTIQSVWNRIQLVSLDATRPAPVSYRFTDIPKGLKVVAKITSINGSVAAAPQVTQSLIIGYDASWILPAPSNVNISAKTFGVSVSWDAVVNAHYYEVAYSSETNPTFSSANAVLRTTSPKLSIPVEAGTVVYIAVRAIHASGMAGSSTTANGSASNVPIGASNKFQVMGPRSITSSHQTKAARTVSYHSSPGPIRIRKMGIYVHDITLNGGNTQEYVTVYNGDETTYYSIPVSGEGYFTDDSFPQMDIGPNERIRVAAWNPSGPPAEFNDIEITIDYKYDELDSEA